MNRILERMATPTQPITLETSVKHYNNLSPMFRGPATSNTLLEISKHYLNSKVLTRSRQRIKSFHKGPKTSKHSRRTNYKQKPFTNEVLFNTDLNLEEIPPETAVSEQNALKPRVEIQNKNILGKKPRLKIIQSKSLRKIGWNKGKLHHSRKENLKLKEPPKEKSKKKDSI